ncbi:MAG: DUF4407 domain-containing protein [Bacteroidales bacterium]|nr:DUF4407 domain-containing protein [Bacteroidales bacterium]
MIKSHLFKSKNGINNQTLIDKEFIEIENLKLSNEKLAIQLKSKEIERNKLFEMVVKEAEGNSITGKIGKGPVYKEKKQAYDKTDAELTELKSISTSNDIRQ